MVKKTASTNADADQPDQNAIAIENLRKLGFTSTRIGKVLGIDPEIVDRYISASVQYDPISEADSAAMVNDIVVRLHDFLSDVLMNGSMANKMRVASMIVPRMFSNVGKNESATISEMRQELASLFSDLSAGDEIGRPNSIDVITQAGHRDASN